MSANQNLDEQLPDKNLKKGDRKNTPREGKEKKPNMFALLGKYSRYILLLVVLALLSNGINLVIPKIISYGIDSYTADTLDFKTLVVAFFSASFGIFIFTYLQSIVQTIASERVARDLRTGLSSKIAQQTFGYIEKVSAGKLLTNLTSDVDAVKSFISRAIPVIISSIFLIIGVSVLLLTISWKLGLAVLTIIPLIGFIFYFIFDRVKVLFKKSQEVIDWLNRVISESILGAALIRVLNAQQPEYEKFVEANKEFLGLGMSILKLFATLIPLVVFVGNMALLTVLALGGHLVIAGSMTLGDFAAFNSYISLLIFPIMLIGFMSNVIARSSASYARIYDVLETPAEEHPGTLTKTIKGHIWVKEVQLSYGDKLALKDISFEVVPGSRTAIIGPTAAGKTQLFYLLTGLTRPDEGVILFDGHPVEEYKREVFHDQIGLVFQDSILFNMSIRENIAFNKSVRDDDLEKAVTTAELKEFIDSLPLGLDTIVSEGGTSLSGGQKQRIMLARALALNPGILLLDDFTARVDMQTELKILSNVKENYPDITLLSITQKIEPVKGFDQIILLMQSELLVKGTHESLMKTSPEYNQIYQSQRSTSSYELQSL